MTWKKAVRRFRRTAFSLRAKGFSEPTGPHPSVASTHEIRVEKRKASGHRAANHFYQLRKTKPDKALDCLSLQRMVMTFKSLRICRLRPDGDGTAGHDQENGNRHQGHDRPGKQAANHDTGHRSL